MQKLAGNAALTADIVAEIVQRTDGVPLFVEELTKAVLESAAQGDRVAAVLATTSLAALSVPATLHVSLMARLDRLGPMPKEIAQIGAVLGREFAYELIAPVAQRPEKQLRAALDQLCDAGVLFCRGTAERAVRAGLELVTTVSDLKTHAALQTRVGIATGLVVVGDLIGSGASQEQAIAGSNRMVIAEGTRRLRVPAGSRSRGRRPPCTSRQSR